MNKKIQKAIATTTLLAVGTIGIPFSAMAADTTVASAQFFNATSVVSNEAYTPVRTTLNTLGIDVEWENINTPKLVLTYGSRSYQVLVDRTNMTVQTADGSTFAYYVVDGSIQLPTAFYQSIIGSASVYYDNYYKQLVVEALGNGIYLQNLDAYVMDVVEETAAVEETYSYYESGQASWYGPGLNGNYTSSGEIFNMYDYTAAHKYLAFGTRVRVTNQATGQSVVVRINDRGPFAAGRVIDLSYQAASEIGMISSGTANVTLEILS